MEANASGNPHAAHVGGLIPAHFALISVRQAKEAGGLQAELYGIRVREHPVMPGVEWIYEWPDDGQLLMIVNETTGQAWADPKIL